MKKLQKKFRVTTDKTIPFYYVHKRFLYFWWVKCSISKTNCYMSRYSVMLAMRKGHYNFDGGEFATYYYVIDSPDDHTVAYYDSVLEYQRIHSEDFI
jgi:hypothetical protein